MNYAISALLLLCSVSFVYAQEGSRKHVGKIIKVKGEAYLEEEGKETRLTARDKGTLLFAEQKLKCRSRCRISFSIGSTTEEITEGNYVVPNVPDRPSSRSKGSISAGSRTRGVNDILLAPVEKGVGFVRPESFELRWLILMSSNVMINVSPLTISLYACKTDDFIWSQANIDYKKGSYVSNETRKLLKQRQKQNSATEVEVVVTSDSFHRKQRFCFEIISASEEHLLRKELAEWDDYADSVRHVERAHIFYKYKLYAEAADEYDMVLKLLPPKDYLLADAIKTHYLLGNVERVKDLLNQLGKLSPGSRLYDELLRMTEQKNKI